MFVSATLLVLVLFILVLCGKLINRDNRILWLLNDVAHLRRTIAARDRAIEYQLTIYDRMRAQIADLEAELAAQAESTIEVIQCDCGLTVFTLDGRNFFAVIYYADGDIEIVKALNCDVEAAREHVESPPIKVVVIGIVDDSAQDSGPDPSLFLAPGQLAN